MKKNNVFPWWGGFFLSCSLRKKYQDPHKILQDYIKPAMKVADIGSGMGYFTLPLAQMVGNEGEVVAVDLQKQMIHVLEKRAKKIGNLPQLKTQTCSEESLMIAKWKEHFEFVLAFAIVHEVSDRERFFKEIATSMKKGAKLLMAEPNGHVSKECFEESIGIAKKNGFKVMAEPSINLSKAVLFEKS